ncbi:unnamed protein product [Pylaiella littoralis]
MADLGVGVKATFSVQGQTVHQFSSSAGESPSVAATGVGQQGPVEGTGKYDYRYTGTHDHGTLPALKTGGPHGELVKALLGAKEDSDAFLTELINQELAQKVDGGGGKQANAQCPSGESKGAAAAVAEGGQRDSGDPEPMELEPCSSSGGAASPVQKGDPVHPPTPPSSSPAIQPAKRPRP